jgi:hypothetical protein
MLLRLTSSLLSLAIFVAASSAATARADAEEELKDAEARLEKLLDETGVFFKQVTKSNGRKEFVVLYQDDTGSCSIYFMVRRLGIIGGAPVYGFSAYTPVVGMPEGETLPPGIIKMVAAKSDVTMLGFYSTSADFRGCFSNATGVLDGLTKSALKITILYIHENKFDLLKEAEPILKEAKG